MHHHLLLFYDLYSGIARLMKLPGHVPGGASEQKIFTIDYQDGLFHIASLPMYQ